MKKLIYGFFALCLSLTLTTCSNLDFTSLLSSSVNELPSISAKGGTRQFQIYSAFAWTAESNQSWCTVTPTSGLPGEYTLTVNVAPYEEANASSMANPIIKTRAAAETRTATITITSLDEKKTIIVTQALPAPPKVYVAGGGYDEDNDVYIAKLWVDGKTTDLWSDGVANSVFVYNKKVYVVGYGLDKTGMNVAKMSIDGGTPQDLWSCENGGLVLSVFVYNDKVYVVGKDDGNDAILWVDGKTTKLWDEGLAVSVYVYSNKVYVAGFAEDGSAMLWEDGDSKVLSSNGAATSVFVQNGKVYVAGFGYDDYYTKLWIDGTISDLWEEGIAWSVYAYNGSVYVAGNEGLDIESRPILYKDGTRQALKNVEFGAAYSVFVFNNTVYVAGVDNENYDAILWIDGVATSLWSNVRSEIVSVFVAE